MARIFTERLSIAPGKNIKNPQKEKGMLQEKKLPIRLPGVQSKRSTRKILKGTG
jgi:hypothetical protein